MNINDFPTRQIGPYQVIDLCGNVNDFNNLDKLKIQLEGCLSAEKYWIVLNLEKVDVIHTFFIKIIALTYKKLHAKKGRLCLIGANETVNNLMQILSLTEVIPIYPKEADFLRDAAMIAMAGQPTEN